MYSESNFTSRKEEFRTGWKKYTHLILGTKSPLLDNVALIDELDANLLVGTIKWILFTRKDWDLNITEWTQVFGSIRLNSLKN